MLLVVPLIFLLITYLVPVNPPADTMPDWLLFMFVFLSVFSPAIGKIAEKKSINDFKSGKVAKEMYNQIFFNISLAKIALVEAIFIYALVIFFLTGDQNKFFILWPVGVIWGVVVKPTENSARNFLERINKNEFTA